MNILNIEQHPLGGNSAAAPPFLKMVAGNGGGAP
jgi:hypothetical protein